MIQLEIDAEPGRRFNRGFKKTKKTSSQMPTPVRRPKTQATTGLSGSPAALYFDPNALAIVKMGSNKPNAKKPMPAATKHRINGSIKRTA